MDLATLPSVLAVTDFWMSRWLTPIWFLGVGVSAGLAILAALIGIFYVMSKMPFLDDLRKSGAAHIVAAVLTLLLAAQFTWSMLPTFREANGEIAHYDELILLSIASAIFFGIFSWALMYCSSTRFMLELKSLFSQGIGLYLLSALAVVAFVGLACTPLTENPSAAFASVPKLFVYGTSLQPFKVPGAVSEEDAPFVKLAVKYDPSTLAFLEISSTKNLLIGDGPSIAEFRSPGYRVERDVDFRWNRNMGAAKCPLPLASGADVYVQNQEFGDAEIRIRIQTVPPVREATTFVLVAVFTAIFGLLFMLVQAVSPKTAAIALAAAKSELAQPLPVILMLIVALAILLFVFLPFHTFGEDIKLLKDCGITLILIAATFQAVWSASTSVNEEIEGRTALTLLSKPIHRRSFIIGKMLGIFWVVLFMFVVLGSIELLAVAYKPIYDARESSLEQPNWQQCHVEMMQTIPGLAMAFFQAVVLGAISVALGTRLPLVANFTICFSIYLLGHLTPTIVASAEGGLPLVEFFSQLISAVVPNLNLFSMEGAIDADVSIPWTILSAVLVYTTLYFILATLLGLLLFEDRDLA